MVPLRHDLLEVLPWRPEDLRDIASRIPTRWLDAYDRRGEPLKLDVSPIEAYERLAETGGVVRLEHLELVPGFRRAVARIVSDAASRFTGDEPLTRVTSVVYVGAQSSDAPWHVDFHHNLFVHLEGTKHFVVGAISDPRAQQDAVTRCLARVEASTEEGVVEPETTYAFALGPGDALYVPPFTFHRVESSNRTVSVACSWSTPSSVRTVRVQSVNSRLRRYGLRTRAPGSSRVGDSAKLAMERLASAVRRGLPGHTVRSP